MDTNMSKALMMAAGVLMALMIISTLTFFFRKLTPFQQQLEDIEALEQTVDFNKQYEVYNKNLMLGIDIISVINKAYSNNMAYIDVYGYSQDIKDNYLIDIILETPVELNQTLIVNDIYDDTTGKIQNSTRVDVPNILPQETKEKVIEELAKKLKFEEESDVTTSYAVQIIEENLIEPDAKLDIDKDGNEEKIYIDTNMYKYIIKDSANDLKRNAKNNNPDTIKVWGTASLETYAYSLKKKKFECTEVIYSENTGRIISMTFKEIV